jgi:hypothetical protein
VRGEDGSVLSGETAWRVDLLPGDVSRSGLVARDDLFASLGAQFTAVEDEGYAPAADIDANGAVNILDFQLVRAAMGNQLPPGEPALPAPVPAAPVPAAPVPAAAVPAIAAAAGPPAASPATTRAAAPVPATAPVHAALRPIEAISRRVQPEKPTVWAVRSAPTTRESAQRVSPASVDYLMRQMVSVRATRRPAVARSDGEQLPLDTLHGAAERDRRGSSRHVI